jgi:uncharacterized membrane protein (DUF485 family)
MPGAERGDMPGLQASSTPTSQTRLVGDPGTSLWDRAAANKQFAVLMKAKKRCIIPLFLLFAAYYLLLPVFTWYAPQPLGWKFAGMSVAYIFGLSVIFLAWAIVWIYVKTAAKFDVMAKDIAAQAKSTPTVTAAIARDSRRQAGE